MLLLCPIHGAILIITCGHNMFNNINICKKGNACGSPVSCIYGKGLLNKDAQHTLAVGSVNTGDGNKFQNAYQGIWIENSMKLKARNNQFTNINSISSHCIFSRGQKGSELIIKN